MTERIWTNRKPGDVACEESDGPGGPPARNGTMLVAGFFATSVFVVPANTPGPVLGLHPFAGRTVGVTRRFYGINPFTRSGRVPHLWAAEAQIGVAECPEGFAVYHLGTNAEELVIEDVEAPPGVVVHALDDEADLGDDPLVSETSNYLRGRTGE